MATQSNARIHLVATAIVIAAGLATGVSRSEWVALTGAIALVWTAEALNTAVEFLADEVSRDYRERIKHAKDVAAFGVLVASIGAAVVGGFVFLPHWLG